MIIQSVVFLLFDQHVFSFVRALQAGISLKVKIIKFNCTSKTNRVNYTFVVRKPINAAEFDVGNFIRQLLSGIVVELSIRYIWAFIRKSYGNKSTIFRPRVSKLIIRLFNVFKENLRSQCSSTVIRQLVHIEEHFSFFFVGIALVPNAKVQNIIRNLMQID